MRIGENDENYLQNELSPLGIDCKRRNEFNDKGELEALATAIKEVYFRITRLLTIILAIMTTGKQLTRNHNL